MSDISKFIRHCDVFVDFRQDFGKVEEDSINISLLVIYQYELNELWAVTKEFYKSYMNEKHLVATQWPSFRDLFTTVCIKKQGC